MKKTEVVVNLPLQMALYFNCFYSPWWLITHMCTLFLKFKYLEITYQVIIVTIHVVAIILEISRLYIGYIGNLMEKIPQLAGFLIATSILQLPLTCFLLFHNGLLILPIERAVDTIHLGFVVVEIIFGYMATKNVANYQVTKFQQQVLAWDSEKEMKQETSFHGPIKVE